MSPSACTLPGSAGRQRLPTSWCASLTVTTRRLQKRSRLGAAPTLPGLGGGGGSFRKAMLRTSSSVSSDVTSASCAQESPV